MPRLRPHTFAEVCRKLERHGCVQRGQKGSHVKFKCPGGPDCTAIVPHHRGRDIPTGLLSDIIKQACMTRDDFFNA